MKLTCDCGNEMPFKITEELDEYEESFNSFIDWKKFSIAVEHDEFWITCQSCGKSIRVIV